MVLGVVLAVVVILFILAFVTRRRFGMLGLGMAAGALLSYEIAPDVAGMLRYLDIPVEPLSVATASHFVLVLAPVLVLLFAGPRYRSPRSALIGSVLFAVFGAVLLLLPLSRDLALRDATTLPILSALVSYDSTIIAICTALAVFDMANIHSALPVGKKSKHH